MKAERVFDRRLRVLLVIMNVFLATTAIVGGIWVVPGLPQAWLAGTPFRSFVIPSLALTIVVGGAALVSAVALALRRWWAPLSTVVAGVAIALFEVVEIATMSLHFWLHAVGLESGPFVVALPIEAGAGIPIPLLLQPFYLVYGLALLVLGSWLWLRGKRSNSQLTVIPVLLLMLALALSASVLLGPWH